MKRALALAVLIATVAFAAAPLAVPGFGGFAPDDLPIYLSDPPAQPAGWAFSIWGLIYLWLIVGAGYGLMFRADAPQWQEYRLPLLLSLGPGIFWLWLAQTSPAWATLLIWWMLGTALLALARAPASERLMQRAPVGFYAGWLTAAAPVALAALMTGYGLAGPRTAALGSVALALCIAVTIQWIRPDALPYGAAVIWALVGIVANNPPLDSGSPAVTVLALLGIPVMAALMWRRANRHDTG